MTGPSRETLVILDPAAVDTALRAIADVARVVQFLPPRLALVAATVDPEQLPAIPGVRQVCEQATIDVSAMDLSDEERVFIQAWQARRQPKVRPGEGLQWDSPGFHPPDPPT